MTRAEMIADVKAMSDEELGRETERAQAEAEKAGDRLRVLYAEIIARAERACDKEAKP